MHEPSNSTQSAIFIINKNANESSTTTTGTTTTETTRGSVISVVGTESTINPIINETTIADDNEVSLDAILIYIGQFGNFQLIILLLIAVPMMFNAIFSVAYIFTAGAVPHRCYISECDTAESTYEEEWTQWAIPTKNNGLDECNRYGHLNATTNQNDFNATCRAEVFNSKTIEKCPNGKYVFPTKEVTIANEFGIICESEWKLSMVGTINNLGQFVGIPLGGFVSDRYGRTFSLALGGFLSGFLGTIRSFAPSYEFFLVFEFLDTLLSGTLYATCFIVGIELVGPKRRVIVCCIVTIFYAVGEILLALIAKYYQNWRIILRFVYIPAIAQVIYFWILPESVRWLLSQGAEERAKKILRKAAKFNKRHLSDDILDKLILNNRKQLESSSESKFPIKEAFKTLHWRIINCSFCWIVNVLVYYGISLNSVLLAGDKYINFMLVALVEIPGFLLPYVLMDRIGRRYSLCGTMIVSGLCCLATVFINADQYYLQLTFFLVGKMTITTSFQVLYFFTSEIFPTNLRNSLLSFCSMIGRIGSMLAPQTPLLAKFNESAPALLFAISAIVSGVLSLFFPETTNLILPANMKEANDIKIKSDKKFNS